MTRQELLLVRGMEECAELTQRLSKALNFGIEETQVPSVGKVYGTNRARIFDEYTDLVAVMAMAGFPYAAITPAAISAKFDKVEKYLRYSKECGTLTEETS